LLIAKERRKKNTVRSDSVSLSVPSLPQDPEPTFTPWAPPNTLWKEVSDARTSAQSLESALANKGEGELRYGVAVELGTPKEADRLMRTV
jgi:hypothetical protein